MRRSILPAAALVLASGSAIAGGAGYAKGDPPRPPPRRDGGAAISADMGVITAVHASRHAITLADGNTYVLPGDVKLDSVKAGEMVSVLYTLSASGEVIVTAIKPFSLAPTTRRS